MKARTSRRHRGILSAFTLIELLVVMAIIALLAALLLPALSRAKASAQQVECISRLKQWTLGFRSYADDNDGWIPREGFSKTGTVRWDNWNAVANPQGSDVWYNALSPYVGVPSAASYYRNTDAFYERASLFHCPRARIPTALPGIALFSLAMNSQLIVPGTAPTIQFERIRDTTRTVVFMENLLEGEKQVVPQKQDGTFLGQPAAAADRFAGVRHGQGGNLAFADGHAQWFPGEKVVETKGPGAGNIKQPEVDVIWNLQ
jgi:prepilin-type N-terminal cleavage/methylation domain-containing protein/prepilin-type processing-associated H-X9-DG protein